MDKKFFTKTSTVVGGGSSRRFSRRLSSHDHSVSVLSEIPQTHTEPEGCAERDGPKASLQHKCV